MRRVRWFFLLLLAMTPWPSRGQVMEPLPATGDETPSVSLPNGSNPEPGLLAAGQPTFEQLGEVAAAGFKTILDLRAPDENRGFDEPARARELGLAYHNLPVVPAQLDRATIDRVLELLRTSERPILLHCGTSNRVGGVLYAHFVVDEGATPDVALERAKAAGLRSTDLLKLVQELLGPKP